MDYPDRKSIRIWWDGRLERSGLTRKSLANLLHVSRGRVSQWANGQPVPKKHRKSVASMLGVESSELPVYSGDSNTPCVSSPPPELMKLVPVHDGIPDHMLIQLARITGKFKARGIEMKPPTSPLGPIPYPELQEQVIQRETNSAILFAMTESTKDQILKNKSFVAGREIARVGPTNRYAGYNMIALQAKDLPAVRRGLDAHEDFLDLMKTIVNLQLERDRIWCIGPNERDFLKTLLEMYDELTGLKGWRHTTLEERDDPGSGNLNLLRSLKRPGKKAPDIVIGDAADLTAALADSTNYKVLMGLQEARDAIRIDKDLNNVSALHLAAADENGDDHAIASFHTRWAKRLDDLFVNVYWYLVFPRDTDQDLQTKVVEAVQGAATDVSGYAFNSDTRHEAIMRLYQIVKDDPRNRILDLELAHFQEAWDACFVAPPLDA